MSKIDELERLEGLREKGTLTDAEFIQAKRALLEPSRSIFGFAAGALALFAVTAAAATWLIVRPDPSATAVPRDGSAVSAAENAPSLPTETVAGPVAASEPPNSQQTSYERLVSPTLIGGNLPYFESISGPARQVVGDGHRYELNGCDVWVETKDSTITSITSEISARCNPKTLGYLLNGKSLAQAAGHFGNGRYSVSCIRSCGNAVDPSYSLEIDGYHANNWISYRFDGDPSSDGAYDRLFAWADKMERERGEDYVIMGRYRCDNRYAADAASAIGSFRVSSVTITTEFSRSSATDCA